jgi:hypothetical protein
VCAPDDGWKYHPKHVEQFSDINKLCNIASCWIYIGILLGANYILHNSRIRVKSGVVIVARLEAGLAGVRLPAWTTDFALLQNVHTGRRAHPFSFPEGKLAGA